MKERLGFSFDIHHEQQQHETETFLTPEMQPRKYKSISDADLTAGNETVVSRLAYRQVEKGFDAKGEKIIDEVPEFDHSKKIRVKILDPHHQEDTMDVVLYEESYPIFKQKPGSKPENPAYEIDSDGYPVQEIDPATKNFKYTSPRTHWGSRSAFKSHVQNNGEIAAEKQRAAERAAAIEAQKKAA